MEDGMPGGNGAGRGNFVERRQRAEIQELKLALAEATVQLRIWQKGSEYIERFFGTLKYEHLYRAPIDDGGALAMETARFRDIYNRIRPHQSLGDRTPRDAYLGITGGGVRLGHGYRDTAPGGAYGTVRPRGLRSCVGRSACAGDRSLPYAASAWRGGQPALGVV